MKHVFVLILTFLFLATNAQGIEFFKGSFAEAQAEAKKEGKIIFMDAFAEWCGPCKRMAQNVFPTKEAGDFFNKNFVNVKMDMEKGEGIALAQKYGVRSYPTLLFLDYTGEIVYQTRGARSDAAGLIEVGQEALKPNENALLAMNKKWADGDRDLSFLKDYVQTQAVFKNDYTDAFSSYINALTPENKKDENVLAFVLKYTNDVNSVGMKFISENKTDLKNILGPEKFDNKIFEIANATASNLANESSLKDAKAILNTYKPTDYAKQISLLDVKSFGLKKDWAAYDKAVTKYLKKYEKNNDAAYNSVAWNYYMYIDDVAKLAKAEKWMQSAIKSNNSYANNLTQSYLLYKLEKYSEAQDAVEYALILAKEGTNQTQNAEVLKGKIEEALAGNKKEVLLEYKLD